MIKLVVFDWDGTLMDSEARIVHAMCSAFLAHAEAAPPATAVRDIIGLDLRAAVARLGAHLAPGAVDAITTSYRQAYAAAHAMATPLYGGAYATLQALRQSGVDLAVATGKSRAGLDRAMREAGVAHFFASTCCGEESAPKPHPAMLLEILADLDVAPTEAIMVGDTEFDMEMAAAASVHRGAVTYGAHPKSRLLNWDPAIVVDALSELPGQIQRRELERIF